MCCFTLAVRRDVSIVINYDMAKTIEGAVRAACCGKGGYVCMSGAIHCVCAHTCKRPLHVCA